MSESGIDFEDRAFTEETPTSDFSFLFEKKIPDTTPKATNKSLDQVIQE